MTTNEQRVWSNYPVSPGSILKEEIDYLGISHRELATMMDCSNSLVDDIIAERAPVTSQIAADIEKALGIKAYIWTNLETTYRITLAHNQLVAREGPNHTCDLGDDCPARRTYDDEDEDTHDKQPHDASILMDDGE